MVPPEKTKLTDGTLKHGKQKGKRISLKYAAQAVGTLKTDGSEIHQQPGAFTMSMTEVNL